MAGREFVNRPVLDKVGGTVRFTVVVGDLIVKASASRELLQERFGAGNDPESWLQAYLSNTTVIDGQAAHQFLYDGMSPVMLHNDTAWDRGF